MVLRRLFGRLAAGGPARVFAVAGSGARDAVQDLRLIDAVQIVDSPRAADVLLVAGGIPAALTEPMARLHDGLAHPRGTVFWTRGGAPPDLAGGLPSSDVVEDTQDVVATIQDLHRGLMTGARASEAALLPDVDPAPWRGVGPFGQGGSGMTGGTPYGRPLAELGADRDGLRLDVLPLAVGPFFPRLPTGLILDLKLAGDIIVEAAVRENPYGGEGTQAMPAPGLRPFIDALSAPVPIAELEMARARHHLRWLAEGLLAHQLDALGLRALALATSVRPGDTDAVRRLERAVARTQALGWSTHGVARIKGDELAGLGLGPVARASGVAEDVRMEDARYRALGFEPVVLADGDTAARWRLRLTEAAQSLELAAKADADVAEPRGRVESPHGRLEAGSSAMDRLLPVVPRIIEGLEWGDAVATLTSLDLDWDEASAARHPVAREGAA